MSAKLAKGELTRAQTAAQSAAGGP
jgi:hypothetical protein